jgi:hypothetical protein
MTKFRIHTSLKYKIIGADTKEYGPVDEKTIREWIRLRRTNKKTPCQREGVYSKWRNLEEFEEFKGCFNKSETLIEAEIEEEAEGDLFVWPEGAEVWSGPHTITKVNEMLAGGELTESDFAAFEGSSEGATIADIPGLAELSTETEEAPEDVGDDSEEEDAPVPINTPTCQTTKPQNHPQHQPSCGSTSNSSSCSYCARQFGSRVVSMCVACEIPLHMECWEVNGGCHGCGCLDPPIKKRL